MKKFIYLITLFLLPIVVSAATDITTYSVSGHWTLAGSPYRIHNDIAIDAGTTLVIDPGVEVVFLGYYSLYIDGGLLAAGNAGQRIRFHVQDTTGFSNTATTAGAWKGMYVPPYTNDSCSFKYCDLSDVKNSSALVAIRDRQLTVAYCNFFHNTGNMPAISLQCSTSLYRFVHCKVYENQNNFGCLFGADTCGILIDSNEFRNNNTLASLVELSGKNIVFKDNLVHDNFSHYTVLRCSSAGVMGLYVAKIKHNTIYGNRTEESAVLFCNNGMTDIEDNLFCNNQHVMTGPCGIVYGGGAIFIAGGPGGSPDSCLFNVRNNVLANNYAPDRGGGMMVYHCRANIINNTIVNNRANEGGAIYIFGYSCDSVNLINNIIHGNYSEMLGVSSIEGMDTARVYFHHNYIDRPVSVDVRILGNTLLGDTTTNIVATPPPGLTAPTLSNYVWDIALVADFHLVPSSACIGAGLNSVVPAGARDRDGNPRIYGDAVDLGAYEWNGVPAPGPSTLGPVSPIAVTGTTTAVFPGAEKKANGMTVYPNPSTGQVAVSVPIAIGSIEVMDATGRVVARQDVSAPVTRFTLQDAAPGLYLVVWRNGPGSREVAGLTIQ